MWGGVIVWNPPGCSTNSETMHLLGNKISHQVRGSFVNLLQLTSSCIVFLSPFLILQWGHNSFDTISFVYISLSPLCCLMVTHFYLLLFFSNWNTRSPCHAVYGFFSIFSRVKTQDWHMNIPKQDLEKVFEVFMGQLRQLFGLKSNNLYLGASGTFVLLASERGFTEW